MLPSRAVGAARVLVNGAAAGGGVDHDLVARGRVESRELA